MGTDGETMYEVAILSPDGRWVRYGPLFHSMTAAELWMLRGTPQDYRVTPVRDYDSSEGDWP